MWRRNELEELQIELTWLDESQALAAARSADTYLSKAHYGLDRDKLGTIERLDVNDDDSAAPTWLRDRIADRNERLLIVFDESDVCLLDAAVLISHWREMFLPSRDDVVILPHRGGWVLYYSHLDEFEFARLR